MNNKIQVRKARITDGWLVFYPDGEVAWFEDWIGAYAEAVFAYVRD